MDAHSHSYGTRIRHNITIKPSARRRHSPDPPLKSKQTPTNDLPHFPPPNIVLHPDDATSKVFLAIARSFLSVDNRAMTIKDLSEMTVNFGLVCQNVSAASQAITTYIRTHMHRCDTQQDHPLLLRHVLSGTPSDDDLLPALHSRSGGAHCTSNLQQTRLTNFRRGTTVWYLSRATGAPCPFARASIRLCDYGEEGKYAHLTADKKRKHDKDRRLDHQHQSCGQKRKRPLRGCVARGSATDSDDDKPPPKVKLTLRLKPLASIPGTSSQPPVEDTDSTDNSDDSMSLDSSDDDEEEEKKEEEEPWSLPPYPRRSISIPPYIPFFDDTHTSYPSTSADQDPCRRSPSVPHSVASPPPDSEDEADDFHVSMTRIRDPQSDLDWDADLDSEGDGETMWESPGPRSPSAPIMHPTVNIAVKEEPRDVQGMLEAWEDFDSSLADARGAAYDAEAAGKIKVETVDGWDWDVTHGLKVSEWVTSPSDDGTCIKQEDFDLDSLFPAPVPGPSSPLSPISSLSSQFSRFYNTESPSPTQNGSRSSDEHDGDSSRHHPTVRPRAKTVPALASFFQDSATVVSTSYSLPPPASHASPSYSNSAEPTTPSAAQTLVSLIHSMSMSSPTSGISPSSLILPPTPCISPQDTRRDNSASPDVVVVHTCQPCLPAISATQIEDISVYQMMLGSSLLLRRIDTDFVNLSPIVAYSGAPHPVLSSLPNATVIKGSPAISGTWVPLSAAQAFVKAHPLPGGVLDVFLSDVLVERFPSALQDFHRSNTPGRLLNQFGRQFASTLQATTQLSVQSESARAAQVQPQQVWDPRHGWVQQEASSTPVVGVFGLSGVLAGDAREAVVEPLSASEQELFHELCVIPEWDQDPVGESMQVDKVEGISVSCEAPTAVLDIASPVVEVAPTTLPSAPAPIPPPKGSLSRSDRPLRRSKRVADAIAAQPQIPTRAHSRRRSARNSIS